MAYRSGSAIYLPARNDLESTGNSILGILQTMGQFEQVRRERQLLEKVSSAITSGKTGLDVIKSAMEVGPDMFSGGITGLLQKIGGAFQPQPNRMMHGYQNMILQNQLKRALAGEDMMKKARTQKDKDIKQAQDEKVTDAQRQDAVSRLEKNPTLGKNPVPNDFDYEAYLDKSEKETKGMNKWGMKAFEGAKKRMYDYAIVHEIDPDQLMKGFSSWWDEQAKSQRTGIGSVKPNTFIPRHQFGKSRLMASKDNVVGKTLDSTTAAQLVGEVLENNPNLSIEQAKEKARKLAKERGYQF